jgi:uncharacterized protein YjbI with pentapeptide repeats
VQLSRILLALTLSIAPLGARGQEPKQPASLEKPCSVSADPSWTPQEKFVWERVCAGEDADFNAAPGYGGHLDPTKPEDWPQNRVLRPKFLEMILFKEPYRSALTRKGVVIVGARFTEAIDLENAELEHPFGLQDSRLEKDVDLDGVRSKFPMAFSGSDVAGTLDMYELELSGDLMIQNAHFAEVDLRGAHVDGQLNLSGSKVTGKLNMTGLRVGSHLIMRDKAEFVDVALTGAHVGGDLNLSGSKVSGELNMDGLQVIGSLDMENQFADVSLIGAHVGSLTLRGSKVSGELIMAGLQVGRGLFMVDHAEFADVNLTAAQVGGQLALLDSKFAGNVSCCGLEAEEQVFMSAEFDDRIDCAIAKIKGDLYLDGQFEKSVDLSGAEIDGSLHFSNHQRAQWARGVTLVLHDAKVLGAIPGLADAWAPKLDLDGFTYRSVDGDADQFKDWFGRLGHYVPNPTSNLPQLFRARVTARWRRRSGIQAASGNAARQQTSEPGPG